MSRLNPSVGRDPVNRSAQERSLRRKKKKASSGKLTFSHLERMPDRPIRNALEAAAGQVRRCEFT
jgi:hypothetical protein